MNRQEAEKGFTEWSCGYRKTSDYVYNTASEDMRLSFMAGIEYERARLLAANNIRTSDERKGGLK